MTRKIALILKPKEKVCEGIYCWIELIWVDPLKPTDRLVGFYNLFPYVKTKSQRDMFVDQVHWASRKSYRKILVRELK